jgi:hypothetical protein
MPVEDDLKVIAANANRELDAVHDFFDHSKTVWRSFQILVDEGHTIKSTNLATGNAIDQAGLLGLADHYTRTYLATFTFRHFVSAFEVFLFDFLHRLLLHNPRQFAKSALELEAVLKAANREEIISGVILKKLNELKYDQLREWFVALERAVHLGCPSDDEIAALAEVKAARDILEHNAGVVNETYCRKAGAKARYVAGDHIEINDAYHLGSWQLIKKVVADVTAAAIGKLTGP